jgi:octaprenyl-diphosphate synthase
MSQLDSIIKPIATEMQAFEKHFQKSMKSPVPLLDIITNYLIRRKGKQIRPLLVFLSAKACGEIKESTYTAATLIELLHTATLIHDDVVDESYERRGFFSLNALWKTKVAVLVGDYLLSQGLLISLKNKNYDLLETVSEAVKKMSEGELLQIQSARKTTIDIDNYYEIINKKTASLIKACTLSGSQSATNNTLLNQKLSDFGENFGMAFQIKDDLFDYQTKGIIGKPVGNDIKDKKFTLPLIIALNNSTDKERKRIIQLVNNNENNKSKISVIIDFVTINKGIERATEIMNEYKNKAIHSIIELEETEAKNALIELVNYSITRNK